MASNGSRGCRCCLCKLIFIVLVIIALAAFLFWLVFRPTMVDFHVTDANLTQFDYANNTLRYNLALNMTIHNPNKKIGIQYDNIEARAFFLHQRFHTQTFSSFYQGYKNTSVLNPLFKGQQFVLLGTQEKVLSEFNKEKDSGIYNIDVKLYLRLRLKFQAIKVGNLIPGFTFGKNIIKPKFECDLKIPLRNNNNGLGFETTYCHLRF
ncbi:Late embryogenesis abundant protein [Quillaja saponaria]|uniref:Late embryogenesis abundant protein n=1 Tax=Quillaja saponaria TaxID=32244 RepID=A0AAD7Q7D2_QUISA|nr:Late embryogenesis abundant protein [Quillaja saponaria]